MKVFYPPVSYSILPMTQKPQHPPTHPTSALQYPARASGDPFTGLLVAAGLLVVLIGFASAPVVTGIVIFGLLATVVGYRRMKGHLNAAASETQSISLPGVGTVRYRIRPR